MIGIDTGALIIPFMITLIIYWAARFFSGGTSRRRFFLLDIVFIAYVHLVIGLLYFPLEIDVKPIRDLNFHLNLIPLRSIQTAVKDAISSGSYRHMIQNVLGNLMLFVPLSLYLAVRFPQRVRKCLIMIVLIATGAEIFQFLLIILTRSDHRVIDIDDLMLNVIGGIVSWFMARSYLVSRKQNPQPVSKQG